MIHPLLFAIYPILALFVQNSREVRVAELRSPLFFAVLGVSAIWLLFGLLMRDFRKAGLVASLGVAFFFTVSQAMGPANALAGILSEFWVNNAFPDIDRLWVVIPEWIVLAIVAVVLARWRNDARTLTGFLDVFAIALVAMPALQVLSMGSVGAVPKPTRQPVPFALGSQPLERKPPDIYYIILDGYARSDVMKSLFDFDNSGFLDRLESKGFYVARRSTANYCQTPLCLSSSLNSCYLDEMVKDLGTDQTELAQFIGKNDVVASLRPLGYRFVTFATGFDPTEHPEADAYLSPHVLVSMFERMLIDMTPIQRILPMPRWEDQFTLARQRILYMLDHLPDVARDPAPTFTFAHFLCPHLPFVFGENGEDIGRRKYAYTLADGDRNHGRFRVPDDFRRSYRAQAAYITRKVEETIDRLLAESPEPPIIILQSDHGSELYLDFNDVNHTDLHERMSILNAYYFPGGRYEGLNDRITPVNSFRVVLNTFFGAKLELLPDKSFFSTWNEPYKFIDVTESVRSAGPEDVRESRVENPPDS